jgi:hypothetical protein
MLQRFFAENGPSPASAQSSFVRLFSLFSLPVVMQSPEHIELLIEILSRLFNFSAVASSAAESSAAPDALPMEDFDSLHAEPRYLSPADSEVRPFCVVYFCVHFHFL